MLLAHSAAPGISALLVLAFATPLSHPAPLLFTSSRSTSWGASELTRVPTALAQLRGGEDRGNRIQEVPEWSAEEDAALAQLVGELGRRWTEIRSRMVRPCTANRESICPAARAHSRDGAQGKRPFFRVPRNSYSLARPVSLAFGRSRVLTTGRRCVQGSRRSTEALRNRFAKLQQAGFPAATVRMHSRGKGAAERGDGPERAESCDDDGSELMGEAPGHARADEAVAAGRRKRAAGDKGAEGAQHKKPRVAREASPRATSAGGGDDGSGEGRSDSAHEWRRGVNQAQQPAPCPHAARHGYDAFRGGAPLAPLTRGALAGGARGGAGGPGVPERGEAGLVAARRCRACERPRRARPLLSPSRCGAEDRRRGPRG
jgi:hypothetical protein